ncbi:MAG: polysaccharide biosynthesis/export family protein [Bryobacteraceae bacterium]
MSRLSFGIGTSLTLSTLLIAFAMQGIAQQEPVAPPPPPRAQPRTPAVAPGRSLPMRTTAGSPADSKDYKIGPTDILMIRVWNEPEFSGPVSVHDDGNITLPLVGDLPAGGKTPDQVEQVISHALAKYVVKPLVTVTVQEVLSKKYYMDGEVAHPGEYSLAAPTTVLEAISKAGGLQEFANGKKIYILRGDKRIKFNYKDVLKGKHMGQNIELKSDDHVVVP